MKSSVIFTLLIFLLLAGGCAKQTAPTGGPKDEDPPVLERSNPKNKQTNFSGNEIQLTFNEFLQLNNPREQIIITPSIGKKFEALAKKNRVILKLNASLQSNTTYNINFRESIQDITEKNPANIKLAFSTGSYIDSLAITGKINDLLADTPVKNYTVALLPATDTTDFFKHPAAWLTLTDKEGNFRLENLKAGDYLIYAFDDRNKNLIVDSKSERYGFIPEILSLQDTLQQTDLMVFKLDASQLKLISARPMFNYFNIKLSKSISDFTIVPVDGNYEIYSIRENDPTNIKVYNTLSPGDSIQIKLHVRDSLDTTLDTLVYLKFNERKTTKEDFTSKIEYANVYTSNSIFMSVISFNKPIKNFVLDSLYIQVDSATRIRFQTPDLEWNQQQTKLTLRKKIELPEKSRVSAPKKDGKASREMKEPRGDQPLEKITPAKKHEQQVIFTKGAFISAEADTSARITLSLKTIKPTETGVIISEVQTKMDFIIQVLDSKNNVVAEVRNQPNHRFENLPPATYRLRLIIDNNKNGKWDPGNAKLKKPAEPIKFYHTPKNTKEIQLKANWEIGPLLIAYE